jgi:hypothetical protein
MEAPAKDFLDALKMRLSLQLIKHPPTVRGCALIQINFDPRKRLFEIARVLVRLDHGASVIANADQRHLFELSLFCGPIR